MARRSTTRTDDRHPGKWKRKLAGEKPGPSSTSRTKGQKADRVPPKSQERSNNGSDKQQRRPK
ncbi:hypothetical protein PAXRUDRAFT_21908 [Paxillus rubicundulus Ve08.2h10]|uniref:Unplaced genomic scaffold scaffold_5930, whole genome shotgun sequence n=1 Tax=Paxillus rubicundulus Ve08.2h10 TaxID=930991 RepID=A0A0D0BLH8_9AGAM|nr:hypothetical protein PAXRUDRAFT_21908 [Paxillus rubicundulus Ve08.2h10]